MKFWLTDNLKKILRILAQWTIAKYRPGVIAVTGTVGKTSTKEAIYTVLRHSRRVRSSYGNLNNELGLPLTILGPWQEVRGMFFWPEVILTALKNLIFRADYPEILVLEYAADRPRDLDYLISIARPQIGVVTAIGDIPVHVEFYSGPEQVAKEKRKIIEQLLPAGFAVLNFDDNAVLDMQKHAHTPVFTYGFSEGAQVRIASFENRSDQGKPAGVAFRLEHEGNSVAMRIDGAFGKTQAYAAAAAACVGLGFGMNLERISQALVYYQAPSHRMRFVMGMKDVYIIDDSYNASPLSMRAAIETIKEFSAKRKVGVLGDMLELGQFAIEAHEQIGVLAAKTFQILVTVGPRAKFIAEVARKQGLATDRILSFDTAQDAKLLLLGLLKSGDLVLIKGSRAIGLDAVVEEIRYRNTRI